MKMYRSILLFPFMLTAILCSGQETVPGKVRPMRSGHIFSGQPAAFSLNENRYRKFLVTNPGNKVCKPAYHDPVLSRHLIYPFDPLNPWHASDPAEAILSGSVHYLFRTVDRKYFR